jgi:hypothetical protein
VPNSWRLLLLGGLGLALAPVALSACGGDTRRAETEGGAVQTTQTTSTQAPTAGHQSVPAARLADPRRRAYISKTDRICRSVDPERNTAREQVGASADTQEAARSYEKETALGSSELKRLEAVAAPPGDAKLLQANVFGPVRHQLALRAQIRVALAAADVSRLRALRAELDNISRALSGFARGYGWRACGEG